MEKKKTRSYLINIFYYSWLQKRLTAYSEQNVLAVALWLRLRAFCSSILVPRFFAQPRNEHIYETASSHKKIMWVVGFVPTKIGSYEEMMFLIAQRAVVENFEISFVFPEEPISAFRERILSLGAQVFVVPMKKRADVRAIMRLAALIKRERPVILHSNFDWANFASCFAVLFVKVPVYIWHQHNFMSDKFSFLKGLFFAFLHLVADKVIVISDAMKKDLVSRGLKEDKVERIYNGINIAKFDTGSPNPNIKDDLKTEFKILPNSVVLTCVGDARPEKGQIFIIRAFAGIVRENPQSILLLIGGRSGDCYEELKKETKKLGLEDKVVFTEMRSDVPQILQVSDIAIVPPVMEVSLYSIMEAMAASKAVIASRVGGIPEVVVDGKTGILVTAGDVEGLRCAVNYLISNPSVRKKMGEEGRRVVEEKFNLNRDADDLLELYEVIMQSKRLG